MFSTLPKTNFNFSVTSILSSANAFNLDLSEILTCGKELRANKTWNQKRFSKTNRFLSVLGNANTVVSDDNFSQWTTKIPYIGFHRTTIFSQARVPNQLVSLIVSSGDSLRHVNKAKISIHA